ncbi:MAG: hypothetical protein ACEPOW_13745 [Bacteroidales bacterium]
MQSISAAKGKSESNLKAMQDSVRTYKDKYGRVVAEKRSLVISKNELKGLNDSLRDVIKGYKPEVVVKWKTKIEYKDTLRIPYPVDIDIPYEFEVPFKYKDKWSLIEGLSTNKGLAFHKLQFNNEQSLTIGDKRDWFLGKSYSSVKIVNTNPNANISGVQSFIIRPKKRFIDQWYVQVGIGVVGGFLIAK